ncbi:MAG: ATP-binding protein [Xanthobacteraceae bacterium]
MISGKSANLLIIELNETDETEHLEAKAMLDVSVGRSVFETICAMSNEPSLEGGTILLGVEKEEALFPFYTPVGVSNPDKISSDIASGCASIFNNPVRVDIKTEKIGKAKIVRIDVPELASHQKPLYFQATGLPRGAFRRIGPTDHRCTEEDLLLFFKGKENSAYDTTVVQDATWEDIDRQAIEAYRRLREEANPAAEELRWSDEDLVHSLGGLRRLDGKMKVTVTGLIVFGKSASLRRIYPSHRVDYIRVPGTQWVRDISRQFDSIEMRGPLMTLVGRVIAAIVDDLPRAFRFDHGSPERREDLPLLPVRAILEAVVNSLIHRNYQAFQPVQIVRYSNRVEFKNPGYSLKSSERFDDPTSIMRNPHVAEVMHETRLAETKGSGIRRMRQFMEETGLSSPTFDSNRDTDLFTVIFLFHHFLNPEDWEWLSQFKAFDLTDDQRRALIFVREVGAIDNQTYRSLTQNDTLAASKSLRKLRLSNLLSDRGSSSRTYYVPGSEMVSRISHALEPSFLGSKVRSSGPEAAKAAHPPVTIEMVPQKLRTQIKLVALGKRLTPELAYALIEALCIWRPLSTLEISNLLGKNAAYISQAYLSIMIRDGRLRYLYQDQVNHPGQKYIAGPIVTSTGRR